MKPTPSSLQVPAARPAPVLLGDLPGQAIAVLCPVCSVSATARSASAHWICPSCGCWFQPPGPAPEPPPVSGRRIPEAERRRWRGLAETLFRRWLRDRPGRVLELGPAPALLARHLATLGCEVFRLDGYSAPGWEGFDAAVPSLPGGFAGCSASRYGAGPGAADSS